MPRSSFADRVGGALAAELAVVALVVLVTGRIEVAAVAGAWLLFTIPGVLALPRLLPDSHPLAGAASAPAAATVVAALPWAIASLLATLVHAPLFCVWWIAVVLVLVGAATLLRIRPAQSERDAPPYALEASRRSGTSVLVALVLVSLGIAVLGAFKADPQFRGFALGWLAGARLEELGPSWWLGLPPLAAAMLLFARARGTTNAPASPRWAFLLAWTLAIACVAWAARVAFCMPHRIGVPWSLDDVTYVTEAVDAAAGLPLGLYEPSLGAELGRVRSSVSVLGAPLVATLSLVTGVTPAALHHSALPPLHVVLGASAVAGAATLVLGRRPLLAPLAIVASELLVLGSWCYGANAAQYALLEAAQPKSVQLAMLPLQLATIVRAAVRGGPRELVLAAVVAVVAHCVHPFATIVGVVAAGAALLAAPILRVRSRPALLLLVLQLGLGLETWTTSRRPSLTMLESTDRELGDPRESRDLLRDDSDRPRPIVDPRLVLGADLQAALGLGLAGLAIAGARRRRELGVIAAISVAAAAVCFVEPIGRVAQLALHPSIFWRARWIVPTSILMGLAAMTIVDALPRVLPRRIAPAIAVLAVPLWVAATATAFRGHWLRPGPPAVQLSKLDSGSHAVAAWLERHQVGLVMAPARLSIELPQLTSVAQLVRSRPKALRPPAIPVRDARRTIAAFDSDALSEEQLALLSRAYAIEAIVLEASQPGVTATLVSSGWFQCDTVAQYSIWFLEDREEPSRQLAHCSRRQRQRHDDARETRNETTRKQ